MSFRIGAILVVTAFVAVAAIKTSLGVTTRVATRRAIAHSK